MRSRILAAAAVAVLVPLSLTACNRDSAAPGTATSDGSSAAAAGSSLIGVDFPRADTDFWNSYISYIPKEAAAQGLEIKTTNSQNDVQKLISNVQALEGQGAKAIVMAPQDTAAVAPLLQQLETKKIPVVSVDTRPDAGKVYMVVRADNVQLGEKACEYLGQQLGGKGEVAMLMGDTASINGRDRADGFNNCMKEKYAGITVYPLPAKWDAATASSLLQTALTQHPQIRGVYMASSFALSGTQQVLKQAGLTAPAGDPNHVYVVSNDGIPKEYEDIRNGTLDATVSQPADQYAKWSLFYANAALKGETFKPGPTDHDSTIVEVGNGILEDQLSSTLVTKDNVDDQSLWGNQLGG